MQLKKYNIILLDIPWTYDDQCLAGNRGAFCKYPLLTLDELKKLPVGNLADKDCIMFMWVTMPMLREALELIGTYGFKYKSCAFTWLKIYKSGKPFWGMGRWTRSNQELCLLATKGKPKRISASVHQVIESVPEQHSKKPGETYDRILQLCGDLPRIELFARPNEPARQVGWDLVGYDIDGRDIRDVLKDYYAVENGRSG